MAVQVRPYRRADVLCLVQRNVQPAAGFLQAPGEMGLTPSRTDAGRATRRLRWESGDLSILGPGPFPPHRCRAIHAEHENTYGEPD